MGDTTLTESLRRLTLENPPGAARRENMTTYTNNQPTFTFCGLYSGNEPASRWLKRFEYELNGVTKKEEGISPTKYLTNLELLLTGEAASWAENDRKVRSILDKNIPLQVDVEQVKELLKKKFPIKINPVKPTLDRVLQDLRQDPSESIREYYDRGLEILVDAGGQDRYPSDNELTGLEESMLETFTRFWVKGLYDPEIRKESYRGLAAPNRSLHSLYRSAEEAAIGLREMALEREEQDVLREREFYKTIVESKIPIAQVNSLLQNFKMSGSREIISDFLGRPDPGQYGSRLHQEIQYPQQGDYKPKNIEYGYQSPVKTSSNPYINGEIAYNPRTMGKLCINCGRVGHMSRECTANSLSQGERNALKDIVFGSNPRPSFGRTNPRVKEIPARANEATEEREPKMSGALEAKTPQQAAHSVSAVFDGPRDLCELFSSNIEHTGEVFAGVGGRPTKRTRFEVEEIGPSEQAHSAQQDNPGDLEEEEGNRPTVKGKKRVGKVQTLNPLVGYLDDSTGNMDKPISIRQLLKTQKLDLTWLDFLQYSPKACSETRRLLTRMSSKKRRKSLKATPATAQVSEIVGKPALSKNDNTQILSQMTGEERAYRVPVTIRYPKVGGKTQEISLARARTHADPGSDMNCLSETVADEWGLKKQELGTHGLEGLSMGTANYGDTPLQYFVELDVGVAGLWRTIQVVLVPQSSKGILSSDQHALLLGLPWLFDVDAKLGIRQASLIIGDSKKKENPIEVTGVEQTFSGGHKIILYPKRLAKIPGSDSDSSEESESLDSDSSEDF
jgi:hypothetical protein